MRENGAARRPFVYWSIVVHNHVETDDREHVLRHTQCWCQPDVIGEHVRVNGDGTAELLGWQDEDFTDG